MTALRVRWLGRVPYAEADELQRSLLERGADDYLLLLEHPHVYTLGKSADPAHVLVPPASVGADLVRADRGVTSLAAQLGSTPDMHDVVDAVTARFTEHFPYADVERQDVVWRERPSDLSAFSRAAKEGGAGDGRFPDDCDGRAETRVGDPSRCAASASRGSVRAPSPSGIDVAAAAFPVRRAAPSRLKADRSDGRSRQTTSWRSTSA